MNDNNNNFKSNFYFSIKSKKIENLDELKNILNKNKIISWNINTLNDNIEKEEIYGLTFSISKTEGYFIPIKYIKNNGFNIREVLDIFYNYFISYNDFNIVFDARRNLRFFDFYNYDCSKFKFIDVLLLGWLADTNEKNCTLKNLLNKYSNILITDKYKINISNYDLEESYQYYISETCSYFYLYNSTFKYYKNSGLSSKIDQQVLYPLMKIENNEINIDLKKIKTLYHEKQIELENIKNTIFNYSGEVFNINSNIQLSKILINLGVKEKYKSNTTFSTSIDELEKIKDTITYHPIIDSLIEYRKTSNILNNFLSPLIKYNKNKLKFHYKITSNPTGRISSGRCYNNDFFAPINIQSVQKPKTKTYYYRTATENEIKNNKDINGIMIYKEKQDGLKEIEGYDQENNLRKYFLPDKDSLWCSFDMKQEELRIMANLFNEPLFINAFNNNKDIYKDIAIKLFGEENYNEELRKCSKACFSEDCRFLTNKGYIKGFNLNSETNVLDLNHNMQENIGYTTKEVNGIKLCLDNGLVFKVTKDHKLPILKDEQLVWEEADNVRQNDIVLFYKEHYFPITEEIEVEGIKIDVKLAWFLGYIQTCIDTKKDFYNIITDSEQYVDNPQKILHTFVPKRTNRADATSILSDDFKKLFPEYSEYYTLITKSKYERTNKKNDTNYVACLKPMFFKLFKTFREFNYRVPDFIFKSPKHIMEAYLAGVVDSYKIRVFEERKELMFQLDEKEEYSTDVAFLFNLCGYYPHGYSVANHKSFIMTEKEYFEKKMFLEGQDLNDKSFVWRENSFVKKGKNNSTKSTFFISDYSSNQYIKFPEKLKDLYVCTKYENLSRFFDKFIFYKQAKMNNVFLKNNPTVEKSIGSIHLKKDELEKLYKGTIYDQYLPVTINKIDKKEPFNAIILQTSTHMYSAMGLPSHNCSFGILYGMGPNTLNKYVPTMSLDECADFITTFKNNLPILFNEQKQKLIEATKSGVIHTFFGRPRKVDYWLSSPNKELYHTGKRIVLNTPIQGTAGDILKCIIIKLWKEILSKDGYKDKIKFLCMIHDEINFSIKKDSIKELVPKIKEIMNVKIKEWKVPLECSLSVGENWGALFDFSE